MHIVTRAFAPCSRRPAAGGPHGSVDYTNDIMIELVSDKLSVPFRNLRYLIVDDDADQRYLVGRTLNKIDRKSTRLNSSHVSQSRMPSSA